jgi:hypothetical protein
MMLESEGIMKSSKTFFYVAAGIVIVVALLTRLLFARDVLEFLRLTP